MLLKNKRLRNNFFDQKREAEDVDPFLKPGIFLLEDLKLAPEKNEDLSASVNPFITVLGW